MKDTILKVLRVFFGGHIGGYVRTLYFKRFLKQYISNKVFNVVLDAGCGRGDHTLMVAKLFPMSIVYGYDLAKSTSYKNNIKACLYKQEKDCVKNIIFQEKHLLNIGEKEKYNLVYSIDVLEHIPGNRRVVENVFKALRRRGLFYLAMPWDEANSRLLPAIFFKNFDAWADEEHMGEQYSLDELTDLMKEVGFVILEAQYTFGIWGKLAWEVDKALEPIGQLNIFFRPLLKGLSRMDIYSHNKKGDLLVIAQKP